MLKYHESDIRTIALVGHRASGKTTLADALLHTAHAVDRMGSVDDGTSVSDFDEEEHKHHFSVDTSVLHLEHEGRFVHLLDAPGYPDFVGAALEALNAVETAVIVVSAANGIEVNTRRMFEEAGKHNLTRIVVVNKCDADNVHFPELIANIQDTFGKKCVLFNVPDGLGAGFKGVVSVLDPPEETPAGCPVDPKEVRSQLVDAIVECDEAMMEKYLTEGTLSVSELEGAVAKAVESGTVIPIFCTGAKKEVGVEQLLHALSAYSSNPWHAKVRLNGMLQGANGHEHAFDEADEKGEFLGVVFKTVNDRFVGNLSFIRVISGKMDAAHPLVNTRTGKTSRVSQLLMIQGKTNQPVPEAYPGDIIAVAKVEDLHIGDTVSFDKHAPKLPLPEFPRPMFGLAIEPKNRGDEQKISQSLHKIADEDPTFKITHDPQTHELVINGVSQLHLEVIQHRLKKRFDLEVVTKEPKIPYRETIASDGAADYRHKKQTGGRGQFGEVHMRIYPLPREIKTQQQCEEQFANRGRFEKMRSCHYDPDFNFAFIDHIVGGTIPTQFLPAVEKGCKEVLEQGAIAGYRMQDLAVEVHFGKYHDVDSSEAAFKTAARQALRKAVRSAHAVLMEPVVKLEVTIPSRFTGAILGDLNTRRGHVEDQDSLPGDLAVVKARVPLAEVTKYAAQLGSITQGQGSFTMDFSHYDMVPPMIQKQIEARAKLAHDEEDE
ncbi:MAG TPA: elongation factor G [Gemmataceae bacterium]|jgi:elongation factor G|nr:elongation factor G [Gemmataceae bacterium]